MTRATIRSSASISTMPSTSVWNASGRWSRPEKRYATEGEALAAGRDDGRRHVRDPDVGDRPHVRDLDISTVSDARVHDPTAIVSGNVVGQYLRHGVPVAGREVRPEALGYSACRVFQPRRRRTEFVEARERGVEVGLVEHLAAVDQVAFDRQIGRSPATRRRSPLARSRSPPG